MYKFEEFIPILIEGKFDLPFDLMFKFAKNNYLNKSRFKTITASSCNALNWPRDPGVYVIREICSKKNQVIYIGMTGKISKEGTLSGKQTLFNRKSRWNPYRFDKKNNEFQYGPSYEKNESKNSAPKQGYEKSINIDQIEIDCFIFERNEKLAPTFLESLLLQCYVLQYEKLPPANNSF